jgi:steroid delta-isomerase-like uncharacterized protein
MPDSRVAVVERIAAAWNAREIDTFLNYLTDDVEWTDPAYPEPMRGREAVRRFSESVLSAFPDFRYDIQPPISVASDGSRCAVLWRIEGTHSRRLDPPGYSPTQRRAEFCGVDVLDFRGDRVCRIQTFFDVLVPAGQLLGCSLRPTRGSWRDRCLVVLQRLRASWLRAVRSR